MTDKSTCHAIVKTGWLCERLVRLVWRTEAGCLNTFLRKHPSSNLGRLWSEMMGMGVGAGLVVVRNKRNRELNFNEREKRLGLWGEEGKRESTRSVRFQPCQGLMINTFSSGPGLNGLAAYLHALHARNILTGPAWAQPQPAAPQRPYSLELPDPHPRMRESSTSQYLMIDSYIDAGTGKME